MKSMKPRCTVIDHFDSFTYNILSWLEDAGVTVRLVNYRSIGTDIWSQGDFTIVSPGPGHPSEYSQTLAALEKKDDSHPLLGICLGMQLMLYQAGINCTPIPRPMHGKAVAVIHNGQGLFHGLPAEFRAGRYNSLGTADCPPRFTVTARDPAGQVQGIADNARRLLGVQFHPESFLTEHRGALAVNLLRWARSG